MTDSGDPRVASARARERLNDYWRKYEAWQAQQQELARLRAETLTAADQEALAIAANARAEIRRIIVDARRDLLELSRHIEVVAGTEQESTPFPPDVDPPGALAVRDNLLQARHDIRRLLEETRPPTQELWDAALDINAGTRSAPAQPAAVETWTPVLTGVDELAARLQEGQAAVSAETSRVATFRTLRVMAFGLVGLTVLAATWWMLGPAASLDVRPLVGLLQPNRSRPDPSRAAAPGVPPPATERPASARSNTKSGVTPGNLSVVVHTRRPAWIRSTVDGRTDGGRIFAAGEVVTLTAAGEVLLRVGDAGAVSVSVNGGKVEPLGANGVVVTRRFVPEAPSARDVGAPPAAMQPQPSMPASGSIGDAGRASQGEAAAPVGPGETRRAGSGRDSGPAAVDISSTAPELTNAAQRWLDAYYRQDTAAMRSIATRDMKLSDERAQLERLPPGFANVRRALERVTFQIVGETAILTARMTEQLPGQTKQYVSWVSQMWMRDAGQWRLLNVQLMSAAKEP